MNGFGVQEAEIGGQVSGFVSRDQRAVFGTPYIVICILYSLVGSHYPFADSYALITHHSPTHAVGSGTSNISVSFFTG